MQRSPLIWILALATSLLAACNAASGTDPLIPEPLIPEPLTAEAGNPAEAPPAPEAEATGQMADSSDPGSPSLTIAPITEIDLSQVPAVDTSRHSVPLEEIIFDTFQRTNRALPLADTQPAIIRSLMDVIPPLYEPRWATAAQTDDWLDDDDIVLGYAAGGEAYAYPVKILNYHEMVSHRVDGRDILASFCPLCRSGIVYDRTLPGASAPLVLGNTSALFESDMVMFDHQTGSYWNQITGEAIVGPLAGRRMPILPSQMTTWEQWKELHPDTVALSENTGFARDYGVDIFSGYDRFLNAGGEFVFPVSEAGRDPRLDPGVIVLAIELDGQRRAYPLEQLGDSAVNDLLADAPIVVFSRSEGPTASAFSSQLDDQALTFEFKDGRFRDLETGSTWNTAGEALDGPLSGRRLAPLPAQTTFWFSMVANYPDIDIYQGE